MPIAQPATRSESVSALVMRMIAPTTCTPSANFTNVENPVLNIRATFSTSGIAISTSMVTYMSCTKGAKLNNRNPSSEINFGDGKIYRPAINVANTNRLPTIKIRDWSEEEMSSVAARRNAMNETSVNTAPIVTKIARLSGTIIANAHEANPTASISNPIPKYLATFPRFLRKIPPTIAVARVVWIKKSNTDRLIMLFLAIKTPFDDIKIIT